MWPLRRCFVDAADMYLFTPEGGHESQNCQLRKGQTNPEQWRHIRESWCERDKKEITRGSWTSWERDVSAIEEQVKSPTWHWDDVAVVVGWWSLIATVLHGIVSWICSKNKENEHYIHYIYWTYCMNIHNVVWKNDLKIIYTHKCFMHSNFWKLSLCIIPLFIYFHYFPTQCRIFVMLFVKKNVEKKSMIYDQK